MIGCAPRWLLATIVTLVAAMGCSATTTPPVPTSAPATASTSGIDYVALEAEIEKAITTGPATLDNVRAVLISVDGESKITHYRHDFTQDEYGHVFSVTKSVLSILIGIAIDDGLIVDVDEPLMTLLPMHRKAMSGDTGKVTLRHLLTMSGGFNDDWPGGIVWEEYAEPGKSFIDVLLDRRQEFEPGATFWYSDTSAHLAAAVLQAALERADGDSPRTVLDYAREKVFDPLEISTHPSFSRPVPDPLYTPGFVEAGFGWGTDPNGIELGAFGLRLTAPDMIKIGELYRRDGVWNGQRIVPSEWIKESITPATYESQIGGHSSTAVSTQLRAIGRSEAMEGTKAAQFGIVRQSPLSQLTDPDGQQQIRVGSDVGGDDRQCQVVASRLCVEGRAVELLDWHGGQPPAVFADGRRHRLPGGRDHDSSCLDRDSAHQDVEHGRDVRHTGCQVEIYGAGLPSHRCARWVVAIGEQDSAPVTRTSQRREDLGVQQLSH